MTFSRFRCPTAWLRALILSTTLAVTVPGCGFDRSPSAGPTPAGGVDTLPELHTPYVVRGTWGSARDDLWVVGTTAFREGIAHEAILLHGDGSEWEQHSTEANILNALWGFGADDVWAVGHLGAGGIILHWDGGEWTVVERPSHAVYSVWGAAPDDVWAVGNRGLVMHWDGMGWTSIQWETITQWTGVAGRSGSDVWVAGWEGPALHWDGASWEAIDDPLLAALQGRDLYTAPGGDVWPIGSEVLRWDGTAWSQILGGVELHGIAGAGPNDLWIVGANFAAHWDGNDLGRLSGMTGSLQDVFALPSGDAWAVGNTPPHVLWLR